MTTQPHKWLPSEPTNEMLANAIRNSEGIYPAFVFAADYKAMWDAAPVVEQEPVAFMADDEDHGTRLCKREVVAECWGIPYVPLYTHPQPKRNSHCDAGEMCIKCPDDRTPLSKDEIIRIVNELDLEKYDYLCVARAIEKAHGIGSKEQHVLKKVPF